MNSYISGIPIVVVFVVLFLLAKWRGSGVWQLVFAIAAMVSLVGAAIFGQLLNIGVTTIADLIRVLWSGLCQLGSAIVQAARNLN